MSQSVVDPIESKPENIIKIELTVSGMSCQEGCANRIDKELNSTFGIIQSRTSFKKSQSVVSYDASLITKEEIFSIIKKKGYAVKT